MASGMDGDGTNRLSRRGFIVRGAGLLGALAACDDADVGATLDAAGGDGVGGEVDAGEPEVQVEADVEVPEAPGDGVGPEESVDSADVPVEVAPEPRFDPDTYPEASESLFPIAVWSSDPADDRVTVATRYLGGDAVEVVVWRPDEGGQGGVLVARRAVSVAEGGFVAEGIDGLAAWTEYRFAFVAASRRSPVGRFRTAPEEGDAPVVVLGASSCARWDFRPFSVLEHAAASGLDAFVLLGDTTYADDAKTLEEYRENWGRNLATDEYRALRTSTSIVATWDDHEVDNNWDPETFDAARLGRARQAFLEHTTPRTSASERIWRSLRWGRTVELFVLDCRSERRPSTRDSEAAQYISEEQLAWLVAGLEASPAAFKVIANSVPITAWPPLFLAADERWQGYAAQRRRVLEATAAIPGVLWLAGDFHFAAVAKVDPPSGPFFLQTEVLVGPIAHLNPALAVVQLTGDERQFPFLSGERNFGRVTFDATSSPRTITIEHVGESGQGIGRYVLEV